MEIRIDKLNRRHSSIHHGWRDALEHRLNVHLLQWSCTVASNIGCTGQLPTVCVHVCDCPAAEQKDSHLLFQKTTVKKDCFSLLLALLWQAGNKILFMKSKSHNFMNHCRLIFLFSQLIISSIRSGQNFTKKGDASEFLFFFLLKNY